MSRFVLARSCAVPAATAIATPATFDVSFTEYQVEAIQIIIPPGPNGLVGWRLANSGVQVIPYGSNDWIIGNAENLLWPLQDQITTGSWQVFAYNLGVYTHTLYFRFFVNPVTVEATDVTAQPADLSALAGAAAADTQAVPAETPPPPQQPILANAPPAAVFVGPPPTVPGH